jgi:[acyl-carrier-protein] S-malonyltransferase
MRIAWLFPGQGTQAVGMGRDVYESFPASRQVLDLANETLQQPLTHLLFEGPAAELQLTVNAQPAITSVSLASLAAFRQAWSDRTGCPLPLPHYVAGHSVGEYAAVVASGAIDDATGLRLVKVRAEAMHAAGQARPGGMVAVLGLAYPAVEDACRRAREQVPGSYVSVANHNAVSQVAIAGDPPGLQLASRFCQEAGARRCLPLAVSAAFHSAAMTPAAEPLGAAVNAAAMQDAGVPVVANVTGTPIRQAHEIRAELVSQVASPVLWAASVQRMVDDGVTVFFEFGAGTVLTNLIQRLDPQLTAMSIGDAASVQQTVDWLKQAA